MQIIIEYDYNGNKTFEGYISLKNAASVAVAAGAVANNVLNQGVGNITGSQKGFSWSSVAISAVGATAGAYASDKLGLNVKNPSVGQDLGRAAVNAGANALSQLAIRGGKINWQQVATDTILNFSQNRISSLVAEQRAANGNTQPLYADNFDADRKARAQMLGLGGNNTESSTPSFLRLSDDEVFNNAMARQEAEKGFSRGLRGDEGLSIPERYARHFGGEVTNAAYRVPRAGFDSGDGQVAYANPTKQPTVENQTSLADRDSAVVSNGGLIVRTYASEAKAVAASGGLVGVYEGNIGSESLLSRNQLAKIFPLAVKNGNVDEFLPYFNKYMSQNEINTPARMAAFFSQGSIETGGLRFMKELEGYSVKQARSALGAYKNKPDDFIKSYLESSEKFFSYAYDGKNGNIKGTNDGYTFIGRGFFQITGRGNYKLVSDIVGVDYVATPELLRQPEVAVRSATIFWGYNKLNPLADNISAPVTVWKENKTWVSNQTDFLEISKTVNGGYNHIKDRANEYNRIYSILK